MSESTTAAIVAQLELLGAGPRAPDFVAEYVKVERAALARRIRESGPALVTEELAYRELGPLYEAILGHWGADIVRQGDGARPALGAIVKLTLGRTGAATRLGTFLTRAALLDAAFARQLALPLGQLPALLPGMPPSADEVAALESDPYEVSDVDADEQAAMQAAFAPQEEVHATIADDPPEEVPDEPDATAAPPHLPIADVAAAVATPAVDEPLGAPTYVEVLCRHIDLMLGSTWTTWIASAVTAMIWALDPTIAPRAASLSILLVAVWRRSVRLAAKIRRITTAAVIAVSAGVATYVTWVLAFLLLLVAAALVLGELQPEPWGRGQDDDDDADDVPAPATSAHVKPIPAAASGRASLPPPKATKVLSMRMPGPTTETGHVVTLQGCL